VPAKSKDKRKNSPISQEAMQMVFGTNKAPPRPPSNRKVPGIGGPSEQIKNTVNVGKLGSDFKISSKEASSRNIKTYDPEQVKGLVRKSTREIAGDLGLKNQSPTL
jgi:hypothetical protein